MRATTPRTVPPYLKLVPPQGKRFKRPQEAPGPIRRDGDELATILRRAENVEAIAIRLAEAVVRKDDLVVYALTQVLMVESAAVPRTVRNVQEGFPAP